MNKNITTSERWIQQKQQWYSLIQLLIISITILALFTNLYYLELSFCESYLNRRKLDDRSQCMILNKVSIQIVWSLEK